MTHRQVTHPVVRRTATSQQNRWKWLNHGVYSLSRKPSSELYAASPATWDHRMLTATHDPTQVRVPRLNPSRTNLHSIYLPRRDRRLSWPWCCYTPRWYIYQQTVTHPSSNHLMATQPGVKPTTSRLSVRHLNVMPLSHAANVWKKLNGVAYTLFHVIPSQRYAASPAILDHSVTCHPIQVNGAVIHNNVVN